MVVDGKFGEWEEFIPVVLFVADVLAKNGFNCFVKSFGLSVCLGVKCCGDVEFRVKVFHEGFPEFGSKF